MRNNIDQILQHFLVPSDEPDNCLNQNIMNSVRKMQAEADGAEKEVAMSKWRLQRAAVAVLVAAAVVSLGGLSAHAAWKYLKPEQVAEKAEDKKLADAFKEEGSISLNERQSYGGYAVTLLGLTSGKNISQYTYESNGEIKEDRTYAVVAIENDDSTQTEDTEQINSMEGATEFFVSPLIKGEDPRFINLYSMNGASTAMFEDGILYQMVDCDNIEVFAGRGVYLSVNHSSFFESEAYHFDQESGEITRNESYTGLNALFRIPLDASKADEKAAQAQLRQWEKEAAADDAGEEDIGEEDDAWKKHHDWNPENLEKYAEIIPDSVETLKPDRNGDVHYKGWKYNGQESDGFTMPADSFFEVGMSDFMNVLRGEDGKDLIETYTYNEDGTVTVALYHEK